MTNTMTTLTTVRSMSIIAVLRIHVGSSEERLAITANEPALMIAISSKALDQDWCS